MKLHLPKYLRLNHKANNLKEKYHVYMADTSRISIAGLNEHNVAYFAEAVDDAVRTLST